MKALIKYKIIIAIIFAFFAAPCHVFAQEVSVSFQVFYDELSPYGYWIDYNGYGYVWVPNAGDDFVPYSTAGHWVYTDDGWAWVSDYQWGWAPFHYGRWYFDADYGWLWIPGEDWGPAWVSWRSCDGFYGWAPLGPGVGIEFTDIPADQWCFVRQEYIASPEVAIHYEPRSENVTYINRSTIINRTTVNNNSHTTYVAGPRKEEVEKNTGARIIPVSIQSNSRPGQSINGNNLTIYKPTVAKNTSNELHPIPAKVVKIQDIPHHGNSTTPNINTPANTPTNSNPTLNQKQAEPSQNKTPQEQQHQPQQQQTPPQQHQNQQPRQPQQHQTQQQQTSPRQQQPKQQPSRPTPPPQHQMPLQRPNPPPPHKSSIAKANNNTSQIQMQTQKDSLLGQRSDSIIK